jgi:hypothetical protein
MLQGWQHKVVTILLYQACNGPTCQNNLATSLIISTRLLQLANKLFQTSWQLVTSSANTSWYWSFYFSYWSFFMTVLDLLEQPCNKSDNINKVVTSCWSNLVDIIRLVARLFQQVRYIHITIVLQPCVVNLVTFLLYHDCIRLVRTTL